MKQQSTLTRKSIVFALAMSAGIFATPVLSATGKLVLTGGVSTIEGAAGGGLTPWAVIGTQATENEWGIAANITQARTDDYTVDTQGITFAWDERIEFSLGSQTLDTGITGTALGLPGLDLEQTIIGVKYRLLGDAILDSDTWMPQVSVGLQYKDLDPAGLEPVLQSLGANNSGTDYYVSATKLFLKQGVLVNGTLRATKANQNGFLGFGANQDTDYELMPEFSVAKLLRNNLAVGAEYRFMTNKLEAGGRGLPGDGLTADDWMDVFVAWAPTKSVSLTAAYVDLGRIVPATTDNRDQKGFYLSAQFAF